MFAEDAIDSSPFCAVQVVDAVTEVAPVARKLRFEEFVGVLTQPLPGRSPLDETRRVFGTFSKDGVITAESLSAAMRGLGHPISSLMAGDMIREADLDGDGVVNQEDFMKAIP